MKFPHPPHSLRLSWLSPGFWCLGVFSLLLYLGVGASQGLNEPSQFESVSQLELLVLKQDKLYQASIPRERKPGDADNPPSWVALLATDWQTREITLVTIHIPDRIFIRPAFTSSRVPQAPPAILAFG